jgi:hypothetical protein
MPTETDELEIPFDPMYVTQWLLDSIIVAYKDGYTQGYVRGINASKMPQAPTPPARSTRFGIGDIV